MSALYKWECGDDLYGTHAKSSPVLKRYRQDINREHGFEREDIYVDTFKLVSEELERIEKLRR